MDCSFLLSSNNFSNHLPWSLIQFYFNKSSSSRDNTSIIQETMNVFYLQWKRNNMLIKARVELKGRGFYTQPIKISMCSCIRKPDISPCLTLQNYQSAVRIVYWFVPCWGEFLTIIRGELSEEWIHELCKYSLLPFNDFILFFAFGRQQEYLIHFWMSYWVLQTSTALRFASQL